MTREMASLPLDGVKVVELGTMITAPYAAMLLAELGASVIKVENPEGGDPFRATGGGHYAPNFVAYNHGKRSISLDLKADDGKRAFRRLLERSDVLVENYRAGVMDKLGFSVDAVRLINPRIVHCSITGFGASGPYQNRPAYDAVASALSGIYGLSVDPADPSLVGVTISDNVTGMYAVNGIVGALYQRERTGAGRRIEVNMLESSIGFTPDAFAYLTQAGVDYGPTSRIASSQCFAFACSDDKLLAIHLSVQSKFWEALLKIVDRPDIAGDPRFKERKGRVLHYHELRAALAPVFAARTRDHWMTSLDQFDVPFAPINSIRDVVSDPQVQHLQTFGKTVHPTEGEVVSIRSPILIDGARGDNTPPPTHGEHTREILAELGLADPSAAPKASG
jgi:crotonobetainyl-CoA:carnitine CoA-transferase CaiB-like acyl-CoA transferase